MLDPWNVDATKWVDDDYTHLQAYGGPEIVDFCGNGKQHTMYWLNPNKCLLVGGRGLGKSFLLAYRSHNHRNSSAKK